MGDINFSIAACANTSCHLAMVHKGSAVSHSIFIPRHFYGICHELLKCHLQVLSNNRYSPTPLDSTPPAAAAASAAAGDSSCSSHRAIVFCSWGQGLLGSYSYCLCMIIVNLLLITRWGHHCYLLFWYFTHKLVNT